MKIRKLDCVLKELKDTDSEVRIHHPSGIYFGKINRIGIKDIILKPYVIWENIKKNEREYFERVRFENQIGLPIDKKNLIPNKLRQGYLEEFIKTTNYFSWRNIKNNKLRDYLFKGYPLPTEKEIEIIEDIKSAYLGRITKTKENNSNPKAKGNEIGFDYPKRK